MKQLKRFLSYYKPHLRLFLLDMACAVYRDSYTFTEGGIEAYQEQGGRP